MTCMKYEFSTIRKSVIGFLFPIQVKATFADETLDFAITSVVGGSNSMSKDVYDYDYEGSGDDGGGGATLDIHAGIEVDPENRELAFDVAMSPGVRFFDPIFSHNLSD